MLIELEAAHRHATSLLSPSIEKRRRNGYHRRLMSSTYASTMVPHASAPGNKVREKPLSVHEYFDNDARIIRIEHVRQVIYGYRSGRAPSIDRLLSQFIFERKEIA